MAVSIPDLYWSQMLWSQVSAQLTKRLLAVLAILLLVWVFLSPSLISAYAGLGGYISEKLLGGAGATSASLYLGSGSSGPVVLGTVPTISTLPATNVSFPTGGTTATLNGNLASLNGMPQADVWFVWGYTESALGNTTPASTVFAVGDQAAIITGYEPQTIYYQFRASTDGTTAGDVRSFLLGGGRGTAFWILWNILTLVIAAGMFILILHLTGNPIAALIGTIIGIIAVTVIRAVLQTAF